MLTHTRDSRDAALGQLGPPRMPHRIAHLAPHDTGLGEKIERLSREVRAMAVAGGSEEVMLDLGIKQARKVAGMAKMLAGMNSNL